MSVTELKRRSADSATIDRSGGGGDDAGLEERMRQVEQAVIEIRSTLPHLATKADLHSEISSQTWKLVTWMTGICGALVAATFLIAKVIAH